MAGPDRRAGREGNVVPRWPGLRPSRRSAEGNGMKFSRRRVLPLLWVPLSGVFPFSKTAEQAAPEPVRTHLILGGDVMLSRHVARVARERKDPAFPLRDLAPVLQAADIAFVNLESP